MKFLKFFAATAFSIVILASPAEVFSCGPEFYSIPTPSLFRISAGDTAPGREEENLRLWQSQTSDAVDLNDLRKVIYGDTDPMVSQPYGSSEDGILSWDFSHDPEPSSNSFLRYLYNTNDVEALNFLMLAKHLARLRSDRNSPWYYPASRDDLRHGFDPVIHTIEAYRGKRFFNRYSLQLIRALFASARYEECISTFNDRFAGVDDSDLMKSMALEYVAGAASRIGDTGTAKEVFIPKGDVPSLARYVMSEDEAFRLVAYAVPSSPRLLGYVEEKITGDWVNMWPPGIDSCFVRDHILPVASHFSSVGPATQKALWNYIAAFCEGEFNANPHKAHRHALVAEALGGQLPCADHIRAYRIALDARIGLTSSLLADLRWLEQKVAAVTSPDHKYWIGVMQHIVLARLVPAFLKKGDTVTALQLANFGDNMPLKYMASCWRFSGYGDWLTADIRMARVDPAVRNPHDFSNTFFQLAAQQSPRTIERYISSLDSGNSLAVFLNAGGYISRDYLCDLAGTLYLRHRDYRNAVRLLAKVSPGYQSLLNVDRDGFLRRDPFFYQSELQRRDWYSNGHAYFPGPLPKDDIRSGKKLFFARQMLNLERIVSTDPDADTRGMARLKYAIGLENSFNSCWALTGYSRGSCLVAEPVSSSLADLSMNEQLIHRATADARMMIDKALSEITDPQLAAKAHYMLHNHRTIACHYPDTEIGRMMAARCDNWSDWVSLGCRIPVGYPNVVQPGAYP